MNLPHDALTVALTGQLAFILIVSTVFSFAVSVALLRRYRRAVVKSMRRRAYDKSLDATELPKAPVQQPPGPDLTLNFLSGAAKPAEEAALLPLYDQALRRPWHSALVYGFAGCLFAATMAIAFLSATEIALLPIRFLSVALAFFWPAVLTTWLIAAQDRRSKLLVVTAYFVLLGTISVYALLKSPALTPIQITFFWLMTNLPATVLAAAFLHRRIRAVGPLVLVFMIFGFTGGNILVSFIGQRPELLRAVGDIAFRFGFGAQTVFYGLHLIGFLPMALLGWLVLLRLRARYEQKKLSDQSIIISAVWLLFAITYSVGLTFEGKWWIMSGLGAFLVFNYSARLAFLGLGRLQNNPVESPRLLLLRVFALGRRSEHLYNALGAKWRTIGSIQMIAGPDLTTTTIEPHEFLDFLSGKLARRFIDSARTLDLRITEMDLQADQDGRFRVSEFFCHDDTWKMTLARLADQSDAVLMDLRSFSAKNAGCIFEINELFNWVPIARVVFVIDKTTDEAFLRESVQQAWRQMNPRSPNRLLRATVTIVRLEDAVEVDAVLMALCKAVTAMPHRSDTDQ
ncbi:MAG: hypothetical protein WD688_12620 [Candidatus Binatia bacterium]